MNVFQALVFPFAIFEKASIYIQSNALSAFCCVSVCLFVTAHLIQEILWKKISEIKLGIC